MQLRYFRMGKSQNPSLKSTCRLLAKMDNFFHSLSSLSNLGFLQRTSCLMS